MSGDNAPVTEEAAQGRAFDAVLNAAGPVEREQAKDELRAALDRAGLSLYGFLQALDDARLVAAVTRDCFAREAFQVLLVERNGRERRLTGYFVRRGVDPNDAVDLVQALYLKLYANGLKLFQPPPADSHDDSAFDRWLFHGCARHLLLDWFRRRNSGCAALPLGSLVSASPSEEPRPEAAAMRNEALQMVKAAVGKLSGVDEALFRGYWESGLRLEELARLHNLSVTSVWRRLQKARETVQAALPERANL
jgi:RNA polymerase sigma factor (sigma-70 family)